MTSNNIDSNSAQENISATSIGSFSFCLPPLPEQKAIAAVLGSLDDKIDLLQRQNATLEAMAETLFRQWFIEEAQEGWGEQAFGNIVTFYDSKRIPLSKREREKMQNGLLYPYYGAAQIVDYVNNLYSMVITYLLQKTELFVQILGPLFCKELMVNFGSIIIPMLLLQLIHIIMIFSIYYF